jgi:hypothetical protein
MFYKDQGPPHYNHRYIGKTVDWSGLDSEDNFVNNCKITTKNQRLDELGWLDPGCITYRYNSQGFRAPELDDRLSGLALGCSHTEGVGIPEDKTWSHCLSQMTGTHVWNFGVGGSSKDTAFRLLDHYIHILNLKFVVLCGPSKYRFEVQMSDSEFLTVTTNTQIVTTNTQILGSKQWFSYDANSDLNTRRNVLAMQQICNENRLPFFYIDLDSVQFEDFFDGQARDLTHPGVKAQYTLAGKINQLIKGQL